MIDVNKLMRDFRYESLQVSYHNGKFSGIELERKHNKKFQIEITNKNYFSMRAENGRSGKVFRGYFEARSIGLTMKLLDYLSLEEIIAFRLIEYMNVVGIAKYKLDKLN